MSSVPFRTFLDAMQRRSRHRGRIKVSYSPPPTPLLPLSHNLSLGDDHQQWQWQLRSVHYSCFSFFIIARLASLLARSIPTSSSSSFPSFRALSLSLRFGLSWVKLHIKPISSSSRQTGMSTAAAAAAQWRQDQVIHQS